MVRGSSNDATPYDKPLRVLIAEDNPDDLELTLRALEKSGLDLEIETVSTRESFAASLQHNPIDLVLSDYRMPGWTGVDAFTEIIKSGRDIPLILLTGTLGDGKAVECIKLGITDYVLKHQLARLPMAIIRAQEERLLREGERRAVDALRLSEAHFRTLVENAPEAIVKKLNDATVSAMHSPLVKERLEGLGAQIVSDDRATPDYLRGFVKSEIDKWAGPIKASGASAD